MEPMCVMSWQTLYKIRKTKTKKKTKINCNSIAVYCIGGYTAPIKIYRVYLTISMLIDLQQSTQTLRDWIGNWQIKNRKW